MEKEPKREKLKDDCLHCGKRYTIKPENAMVFSYERKPECNHMVTECPHCTKRTNIYLAGDYTIDRARENGITVCELDWPSDQVYDGFLQVYGIELIQPQELTPRQEKQIEFAHFLLQGEITIDDMI